MRDGWREVPLGEVAQIQQGKRVAHAPIGQLPHPVYGANGVIGSHDRGTYEFPVIGLGCRGSVGTLHTVPAGAWLGNNVMGVWPKKEHELDLSYLQLALEIADFRASGAIAGQVQPQITRTSLAPTPVIVPPLSHQRRIVNLVDAVKALTQRAAGAADSARVVLVAVLRSDFKEDTVKLQPIDQLLSAVIGGVWGQSPGSSDREVLALGPRVFATGTPGLTTGGSPVRSVSERQYSSRVVERDDIILERSGGSPAQPVGRVVIADGDHEACIPTDFMRLLRPDRARVEPRYLFWRLWLDHHDGRTVGFSRRTTGISNLSVREYLARPIKVPSPAAQQQLIATADAAAAVMAFAQRYEERSKKLGSVLLDDLLSGRRAIPESYDRLLDAAS